MIDKVIHYIWLGPRPIPKSNLECMETWSKLKGFSIRKWTDKDFDFDSMSPYIKMCLEKELYTFVGDYLKCWIIYNYGGLYMDCDVNILQGFEHLFDDRDIFIAGHYDKTLTTDSSGINKIADFIIGGQKGDKIFKDCMNLYDKHTHPYPLQCILSTIFFNSYTNRPLLPYECFDRPRCSQFEYDEAQPIYTEHLFRATWAKQYSKFYDDLTWSDEFMEQIDYYLEHDI